MNLDDHLPDIVRGNKLAFARWLAHAERPVRLSLARFASVVDTEAVLQEAMLRVWQVAPSVVTDGRPNSLLRFAITTARNAALSEVRRRRLADHMREAAHPDDFTAAPAPPPDPFLRQHTLDCLDELPEKPREALLSRLTSAGGFDDEALAERVGMRKNTFLQNVTRARQALLECLGHKGIRVEASP